MDLQSFGVPNMSPAKPWQFNLTGHAHVLRLNCPSGCLSAWITRLFVCRCTHYQSILQLTFQLARQGNEGTKWTSFCWTFDSWLKKVETSVKPFWVVLLTPLQSYQSIIQIKSLNSFPMSRGVQLVDRLVGWSRWDPPPFPRTLKSYSRI